jgi:hypothetical protein
MFFPSDAIPWLVRKFVDLDFAHDSKDTFRNNPRLRRSSNAEKLY